MEEFYIGQVISGEYPDGLVDWVMSHNCKLYELEPIEGVRQFQIVEIPEETPEERRQRLNMLSLTKREVFLALYRDKGLTPEQIRASITNPEALIEIDYATEYYRGNPLIDAIGLQLGYTTEDLDYLFEHGELPE